MGHFPQIQARRAQNLAEKRELLSLEQSRRKIADDEFDHKMKYFKLHKWALIRHHREEMEE